MARILGSGECSVWPINQNHCPWIWLQVQMLTNRIDFHHNSQLFAIEMYRSAIRLELKEASKRLLGWLAMGKRFLFYKNSNLKAVISFWNHFSLELGRFQNFPISIFWSQWFSILILVDFTKISFVDFDRFFDSGHQKICTFYRIFMC